MTLFMPPIQRKKKVDEKYNPDTFRVISEDAVSDHPKYKPLPYRASFEPCTPTPKVFPQSNSVGGKAPCEPLAMETLPVYKSTRVLPHLLPDFRANKPQPKSCGFLDKNVRFLNEPICNVYTKPVQHEEGRWWPTRANPGELQIPPFTEDTHYRKDYNCRYGERPGGSGRHTWHMNRDPALGVIPVNHLKEKDGSQRFYKEGLSYEHMYNSRIDPNYPVRGKRHGAFVWSRMDPISQKKFIEYYQRLEDEERMAQEMGQEGPVASSLKGGSAPVIRSINHKGSSGPSSPKRKTSTASSTGMTKNTKNNVSAESNGQATAAPAQKAPAPPPPAAAEPAAPAESTAPAEPPAPKETAAPKDAPVPAAPVQNDNKAHDSSSETKDLLEGGNKS